jgi:UDP-N-acetylmuramate dehydrogenase
MTIISGYIQFPPGFPTVLLDCKSCVNVALPDSPLHVDKQADTLDEMKDEMQFLENVSLAPYTTFGIGGPARWFAEATHEADAPRAVEFARQQDLPLFVLGGGSNLLVSDAGFPGVVLRIALRGLREHFHGDTLVLQAEAGEPWDKLVSHAVSFDCAGIECLAGIPGTVGGTPVQNVGAYGQEVADRIMRVRAYDREKEKFVELSGAECGFAYRQSLFNTTARDRFIVTRVDYELTAGGLPNLDYADLQKRFAGVTQAPTLAEVAQAVREIRRAKGMYLVEGDPDTASAGSYFKNPVVDRDTFARIQTAVPAGIIVPHYPASDGKVKLAAAWLVEQAGFARGYARGQAAISSRHTLALVNRGGATAQEILELSDEIAVRVGEKFGVRLEREPVWVG